MLVNACNKFHIFITRILFSYTAAVVFGSESPPVREPVIIIVPQVSPSSPPKPSQSPSPKAKPSSPSSPPLSPSTQPPSIAAAALLNPDLSSLVAAAVAANVTGTLGPDFSGTVFLPNNAAFASLGNITAALGVDPQAVLSSIDLLKIIISYHVVPGKVLKSSDLYNGQILKTADDNQTIRVIKKRDGSIYLDPSLPLVAPAKVVKADIFVANGKAVGHIIDQVLLPKNALIPLLQSLKTSLGGSGGGDSNGPYSP